MGDVKPCRFLRHLKPKQARCNADVANYLLQRHSVSLTFFAIGLLTSRDACSIARSGHRDLMPGTHGCIISLNRFDGHKGISQCVSSKVKTLYRTCAATIIAIHETYIMNVEVSSVSILLYNVFLFISTNFR